jgi:hypothetical protein
MKRYLFPFLAITALAVFAPAAEKNPDFSGTWTLDPIHSEIDYGASGLGTVDLAKKMTRSSRISITSNDPPQAEKPLPRIQQVGQLTLTIVQTDSEMKVNRKFVSSGEEQNVSQTFNLDGRQSLNRASDGDGELETRSSWEKGKLINVGAQTIPSEFGRDETTLKEEYSLSKNGKTLTIKTMRVFPSIMIKTKQLFYKSDKK